jgi:hypothetical protein
MKSFWNHSYQKHRHNKCFCFSAHFHFFIKQIIFEFLESLIENDIFSKSSHGVPRRIVNRYKSSLSRSPVLAFLKAAFVTPNVVLAFGEAVVAAVDEPLVASLVHALKIFMCKSSLLSVTYELILLFGLLSRTSVVLRETGTWIPRRESHECYSHRIVFGSAKNKMDHCQMCRTDATFFTRER